MVRAVNSSTVTAYWLIGREIVIELQSGDERAEYGRQVIENLSERLTKRCGKGFSAPALWNFRQFYQVYSFREPAILSPAGREFNKTINSIELGGDAKLSPSGRELTVTDSHPPGDESVNCFNPQLSWAHKLIRDYLVNFRSATRREIDTLLWDKLSDVLNHKQKQNKIGNLITSMRQAETIINTGSRKAPRWILKE